MKIFRIINIIFFANLLFFLSLAKQTYALAKFNTSYQVYYKVENTGIAHVTFVISQKNNLSIVFATEFGISLNETKIANLKVFDEGVAVIPNVQKNQNQTIISFPFAKKVVGKDKLHNFTIEYDTSDIVNKQGNTWQISIPRFESDENVSDQTAILNLPKDFPKPAYIDPKPDIVNGSTYYFSSKVLANKPISAIFGNNQFYKGTLQYYLKNNSSSTKEISITLLPNTAYQSVYYEKLEPSPVSIESDVDGNLLAFYKLKPNTEQKIETKVYVKTDFLPKSSPQKNLISYTQSNKIWNYDHNIFTIPEVKNLTSPKPIYDFVVNKLKYDYQKINTARISRNPASESLKNYLSAICTDYTDLFVTLARKANIPARELEGLALSENPDLKPISATKDVLHAWPEYFDEAKQQWIQVDPTWGSTTRGLDYFNKLDFNHLVFAIHGENPETPYPAGSFKDPNTMEKDLNFEAIEEIVFPESRFEISQDSFLLTSSSYKIRNLTGVYASGELSVAETNSTHTYRESINIPPFGTKQITLKNKIFGQLFGKNSEVIINLDGKNYLTHNQNNSLFQKGAFFALGGLILGILTLFARSLLLRRQK